MLTWATKCIYRYMHGQPPHVFFSYEYYIYIYINDTSIKLVSWHSHRWKTLTSPAGSWGGNSSVLRALSRRELRCQNRVVILHQVYCKIIVYVCTITFQFLWPSTSLLRHELCFFLEKNCWNMQRTAEKMQWVNRITLSTKITWLTVGIVCAVISFGMSACSFGFQPRFICFAQFDSRRHVCGMCSGWIGTMAPSPQDPTTVCCIFLGGCFHFHCQNLLKHASRLLKTQRFSMVLQFYNMICVCFTTPASPWRTWRSTASSWRRWKTQWRRFLHPWMMLGLLTTKPWWRLCRQLWTSWPPMKWIACAVCEFHSQPSGMLQHPGILRWCTEVWWNRVNRPLWISLTAGLFKVKSRAGCRCQWKSFRCLAMAAWDYALANGLPINGATYDRCWSLSGPGRCERCACLQFFIDDFGWKHPGIL